MQAFLHFAASHVFLNIAGFADSPAFKVLPLS